MNRRIAAISILTITACPQNDAPPTDGADEIEASTVVGPDLPVDDSTESDSSTTTGDDAPTDSESTADSGGSTSEESTTDDDVDSSTDTEGETGSEAVPASLIVESNGQRIGYLMGVWDYGLYVWDDVNEITFNINQLTGNVTGASGGLFLYPAANCAGQRYQIATYASVAECDSVPGPIRRNVRGEGGSTSGHVDAPMLIVTTGAPTLFVAQSILSGGNCQATMQQVCGFPMQVTNVIPTTFALPITVSETVALP
jgi:hypothetical protein